MTYGNWGAQIYCDKKPLHKNCDATPNQVLGKKEGYKHYLQHYIQKQLEGEDKLSIFDEMYHGIVGDKGVGILVLLYKSWPSRIIKLLEQDKYEVVKTPMNNKDFDWYESDGFTVDVYGIKVKLEPTFSPEGVECEFTDKKGRKWWGKSAYCYGEGHLDWG